MDIAHPWLPSSLNFLRQTSGIRDPSASAISALSGCQRIPSPSIVSMDTPTSAISGTSSSTGTMASIYERIPLQKTNEIRILRILPPTSPDGFDTLACELRVVSMKPVPRYQALSYVWGDPDVIRFIQVQGNPFVVRLNL